MDEKSIASLHGAISSAEFHLPPDWYIQVAVLTSMMLQLVLAIGGSLRCRSSSSPLQLVVWISYMSADAVAVYALGNMARSNSTNSGMFGVWAPLLLLHLGGPDTITAYSTPDNELWLRHLLNMLYQISVASYVIYLSSLGGYLLAAAILLLFVGASKYAERTQALRCSSISKIATSTDTMNVLMQSSYGKKCNYLVMGTKQWQAKPTAVVTIQDVWELEQHEATENYLLCLSHALFKMYKRRYANLYLHEKFYSDTRRFFLSGELSHIPSSDQVFRIVEVELKFMYDLVFTKSRGTAFTKLGVVVRLINIAFLGVAGFLIFTELRSRRLLKEVFYTERSVSFVLLIVAFVVEFLQLCRILASDWTLVWLSCARVRHSRGRNTNCNLTVKLMEIATRMVIWFRRGPLHSDKYWKNHIEQYSIIDTCSHISPSLWKFAERCFLTDLLTAWYTEAKPIEKELKTFIFEEIKEKCSPDKEEDIEVCRRRLASLYYDILEGENRDLMWASAQDNEYFPADDEHVGKDQEHLIMHWHVATRICEMHHQNKSSKFSGTKAQGYIEDEVERNFRLSGTLSRYCAHLLVSYPKLLPVHADIAKMKHLEVHSELVKLDDTSYETLKDYKKNSIVGNGARLARQLLEKGEEQRWKLLTEYWTALVILYALESKSTIHAERLTVGGEFLTQLWVLLGHMGCGNQF